ncbi:AraC family transcriptional regulator [Alkalicoccobacillus murimartini]|uniref:AraC family transcriptional regulator n=1 Tax=Alkalicoccobacillus murimartini TaxID=171685 RepID=A0ABT9YIJ5_9BACI|nr:AraC family transcriptional regulator [Alkalicoccobacillus murimartini]MDQ0207682.1 AraC family transcriptional regulator [Alkalicoccobacillus murimartini]
MAWIESMQKAIHYIENHLTENLILTNVAQEAHVSVSHFQKTFYILTGITVGEYIRKRRLTQAGHELKRESSKIIDIALKYGYETPEAFSKAFKNQHGITPKEARNPLSVIKTYNQLVIKVTLKGEEPMNYHITERNSFTLVGIKRRFSITENGAPAITAFWDESNHNGTTDEILSIADPSSGSLFGACAPISEDHNEEYLDYYIAVESNQTVPAHFDTLVVPSSKWAVFEAKGPASKVVHETTQRIYEEWFPTSGYTLSPIPELEVYAAGDPYDENYVTEIWVPVQ